MKKRCDDVSDKNYGSYGARGIAVCEQWLNDFPSFLAHIGPRPTAKHSVDRIDNDRGYEPGNVRWATRSRQARNQKRNTLYQIGGKQLCLSDLAELAGLNISTLQRRLVAGWEVERAVTTPPKRTARWPVSG